MLYKASIWAIAIIICLAFWMLVLGGCNPVKNVLRSPSKTQEVVDAYNQNVAKITPKDPVLKPGKPDTTTNDKVDTTTKTVFDTLYVPGDTVTRVIRIRDTVTVTKVKERTINKVDTVDRQDPLLIAQLQSFQRSSASNATARDQFKKDAEVYKAAAAKWKLYFWLLIAGIGIGTIATILLKLKTKSNVQI